MKSHRHVSGVSVVLCLVMATNHAFANPVGESLRAGRARFDRSGPGALSIHQLTDKLIINWRDFSIAAGETTRFIQPSATSIALNRVTTGNPSRLFGNLEANGKVYLINPNGILVGRGGAVNTRGFVASTLDVSDASFLSSAKLRLSGDSEASVVNEGSIQAIGGDVFLVGRTVENSGSIRGGTVGLGAGSEVMIVPTGRERLSVIAGNPNGGRAEKGVNNEGTIEAVSAELKAAGGNIYALAVNNGGVIRATGVRREGGRVFLSSDGGNIENSGTIVANNANGGGGFVSLAGGRNEENPATVINSGVIEARGDAAGTRGGEVRLTGDYVGLFGASVIDVSGQVGGGTALIGGDYQGANARIQNAERTFVDRDSSIRADALVSGNGGKVIVWSDEITRFHGFISARGGSESGNGGFSEVSGKTFLSFHGTADLGASAGSSGHLLLDPQDLFIEDTAPIPNDALVTATGLAFNNPDTTTDLTISDDVLEGLTGNITVQAHRNLFINADLTLANQTSTETVEFQAGGDLEINASVVTGGATLSFTASDAGGADSATAVLTVDAAVGDADTGAISFINDGTGGITINAAVRTGDNTVGDDDAVSGGITVNSGGFVTLSASGSLTTGAAHVNAANGGVDTATSGDITITSGASADVTLAGNVTTGNATVGNAAGNDTATSGTISVTSGGSIANTGLLRTGNSEALEADPTNVADNGDNDDTATSGLISLTAGVTGTIMVNNDLTTGTAKVRDSTGDNDVATTGGITLQSGLGIGGSGRLITGAATLRGNAATGTDSANSGNILLTAGTGVSGGIGLSAVNALTTGDAIRLAFGGAELDADTRDTGDITLDSRDEINNGTASNPLSVLIGVPTIPIGALANQGAVNVLPTVPGGNVFLTSSSTLRVGDVTAGAGNVTLLASEIDLVGGNDSVQGSGFLFLRPATAAQDIEIAGAEGTAALDLTATDLNAIDAGFTGITIGPDSDGTGTLTVAGPASFNDDVTLVGGSIVLDDIVTSVGNNVILTARTGNITDGNDTTANIVATSLAASAQTGIDLDTDITTLASASTVSGNISVQETTGDLAVGSVSAPGGAVTLIAAGAITDANGVAVNVAADSLSVTAQDVGTLADPFDTDVDELTVDTSASNGDQFLTEVDGLDALNLNAGLGGIVNLTLTLGSLLDTDPGIDITADEATVSLLDPTAQAFGTSGDEILTSVDDLTVNSPGGGDLFITEANGLTGLNLNAAGGNVTLTLTEGSLADADSTDDIVANVATLTLNDANDTGDDLGTLADPIGTSVNELMVNTSAGATDGDQFITEADGLSALELNAGGGGNVTLLLTEGAIADTDGANDIIANIATVTLNDLNDDGDDFGASGTGTENSIGTMVNDLRVNTSAGANAGDQFIIEAHTLSGLELNAGAGNVTLELTEGTLTDIDGTDDLIANIATVTLRDTDNNGDDFGALANPIGTSVNELAVDTAAGSVDGDQFITEANALTALNLNAGAGTVNLTLTSGGVTDADPATDITAGDLTVTLSDANPGQNFGVSDTQRILTSVGTLSVDTSAGNGSQFIQEATGLTGLNLNAGGGSVDINLGGSLTDADTDTDIDATGINVFVSSGTIGTGRTTPPSPTDPREIEIDAGPGTVLLQALGPGGGVHVEMAQAGDLTITDSQEYLGGPAIETRFNQNPATDFQVRYASDLTIKVNGSISSTIAAGNFLRAPGALNLGASGSIGGGILNPLAIDAGTLHASAGTGLSFRDVNSVTLGDISSAGGMFFVKAESTLTFNASTVIDAGTDTAFLVANGSPGVRVVGSDPSDAPAMNSRFILYALNARLTEPPLIINSDGKPSIDLIADVVDSPRDFAQGDPDPFNDDDPLTPFDSRSYFVFSLAANPPTDPSQFIDIPVEVFQPVSIVFGDYDPTKFGEVGDLWMSSSELYEIERKAGKARKALPAQVNRTKYVPEGSR